MSENILFLTGKLAEKNLHKILTAMQPVEFGYRVQQLGLSVAALMTGEIIMRRLKDIRDADRIVVPGLCRGDLDKVSGQLGVPVERGPEELKDLPSFFGRKAVEPDLSRHDTTIFAEIVDAPERDVASIVRRAEYYALQGADIIDIGCLPDTPFPHLEEAVQALKALKIRTSVDSLNSDELLRGGKAGANYLLSLREETLWVADEVSAVPVLIPDVPSQPESLYRAMETLDKRGLAFLADPILDPVHSGFTASLVRYYELRRLYPEADILMGTGNITELTHADTAGMNMLLLGVMSELRIRYMLTTEVSLHCRNVVREADLARRILYVAREDGLPPRHIDDGLMALHERKPFPYDLDEIRELAGEIRDPSFRIQTSAEGVHIFNRNGMHSGRDPFRLFEKIDLGDDVGHAFYLGVELARAQIARQLGKRYNQDEELAWGCAVEKAAEDKTAAKAAGPTMRKKARTTTPD